MNKLKQLQNLLVQKKITAYLIPTSDYHQSEYVCNYFKGRDYLTGFTGSAGTLLVTQNKVYLWADGRYHIQAAKQIEGKSIQLMKQGLPGVPSVIEFLKQSLKDNDVLGFDGKVCSTAMILEYQKELPAIQFKYDEDLLSIIWDKRPEFPFSMLYRLEDYYAGETFESKLKRIREAMADLQSNYHILVSLEDQAWLYNLRANDVENTPVFLAYTIITDTQCHLFTEERRIDKSIEKYLKDNQIILHAYEEFYSILQNITGKQILVSFDKINYTMHQLLIQTNTLLNHTDPSFLMKAIKNDTELKNIYFSHIKDGVAFTKFMYYLKKNIGIDHSLTELTATEYLETLRLQQQSFIEPSFHTICAYKDHAAMMHYTATKDTDAYLLPSDFLLVDSGGHYLDGTTDITRTIALGPLSAIQKIHFTTVLKSVIALSQAVFLKGVKGSNLDVLARNPIWKELMDYKCGTGHGVGYLLSVHEGPNSFRWQNISKKEELPLEPGMITTNEPGIYLENKYGIRIENEMLCIEKASNEFGDFLAFETITYAPIDLDAIDINYLSKDERLWLNRYHQHVYETIAPFLDEDERIWLQNYTREI